MAHLPNGQDPRFNGGAIDESWYQLAGTIVEANGDSRHNARSQSCSLYQDYTCSRSHHLVNGGVSDSDLQHMNDTISNFSLSPRPIIANSAASSSTTNLPATASKPSKSKTEDLNHRVRSKSASQMGYQSPSPSTTTTATKSTPVNRPGNRPGGDHEELEENRTLRFVGKRGLAVGYGDDITSAKGTVRGVTNRVKAGIMNFTYKPLNSKKVSVTPVSTNS